MIRCGMIYGCQREKEVFTAEHCIHQVWGQRRYREATKLLGLLVPLSAKTLRRIGACELSFSSIVDYSSSEAAVH